jgi:hypothetical protein
VHDDRERELHAGRIMRDRGAGSVIPDRRRVHASADTVPVDLDLALARWENEGGLPGNLLPRGPARRPVVRV